MAHILYMIYNNGYIIMKSFWNQLLNVQFIVSKFKYHVTKIFYWIRLWHMFCHTLTHLVSYSFMQCHRRWQWQRFMTNMWHPFNMKLIEFGNGANIGGYALRQVSGIKYLNQMSTHHSACGIVKLRRLNDSSSHTLILFTYLS